jgi:hypothetical protein
MNLLFQTTGTSGSTEIKTLLGALDADIKLQNLIPDLITSTNEVIDLIGIEVYNKAVEAYNNGDIAENDKSFVYAVRYPIAVNAYRLFAPSNDISHTNNGRKMKQDNNEKLPFQWMIDADNASLEKRYYRALDDLIKFLDRSKVTNETSDTLHTIWTNSDAFKATQKLFIRTVSEFDEAFPIQSRLLLIKLAPGISKCEQYEIRPRVSVEKFNALKSALKSNTAISDATDLTLIRLIREASAAYSLAWGMIRYSAQLFPEGVLQHVTSEKATTKGLKPTLKNEPESISQAFMEDAKRVFTEIEKLLEPPLAIDETAIIIPEQKFGDKYFSA